MSRAAVPAIVLRQRQAAAALRRRRLAVLRSAKTFFVLHGLAMTVARADPAAPPVDFVAAGLAWSAPDDSEED